MLHRQGSGCFISEMVFFSSFLQYYEHCKLYSVLLSCSGMKAEISETDIRIRKSKTSLALNITFLHWRKQRLKQVKSPIYIEKI